MRTFRPDRRCRSHDTMKTTLEKFAGASSWSSLATLALLFGIVVACSSSGAPSNRLLEDLLNARTVKESNDAFFAHGPIREEELPAIFEATSSSTNYRRRNEAQLLRTTVKGNAAELEHRVILQPTHHELCPLFLD